MGLKRLLQAGLFPRPDEQSTAGSVPREESLGTDAEWSVQMGKSISFICPTLWKEQDLLLVLSSTALNSGLGNTFDRLLKTAICYRFFLQLSFSYATLTQVFVSTVRYDQGKHLRNDLSQISY